MSTKLICYLSLGYPSIEKSIDAAKAYVQSGCDIIEVGWPTYNAYLDSEFIGYTMKAALDACKEPEAYYQAILKIKESNPSAQVLLVAYEHTLEEIGVDRFMEFCIQNSILDLILVGTKDDCIKNKLMENGLRISCYIEYDLPDNQIAEARNSNSFVYLQAKPTGRIKQGYETLEQCIGYVRNKEISAPIYCGVGISTRDDVQMASKAGADGVFIGSAVIKLQDQPESLKEFIKDLKSGVI